MGKSQRWKDNERAVARLIGGQRVIEKGLAIEDVHHSLLSVEAKTRETLPLWLWQAVDQARANCPAGRWPAVFLHQKSGKRRLVLMDSRDFLSLLGARSDSSDGDEPVGL